MAGSARSAIAAKALQTILNIGLLVLAIILVVFLVKETFPSGESAVDLQ